MNVLFVSSHAERLFMPTLPLGLALVAAATRRAGHETRFLDRLAATDPLNEVRQNIAKFQPEVIALSIRNVDDQSMQAMNKRFGPAEVRDVSERLAVHGIRRMGFLLLGGPGETRESVDESLAFARSLNLEILKVSVGIRLYPHTPLARLAVEEGVVSPDDDLLVPRFCIRPGLEDYIREVQGEI